MTNKGFAVVVCDMRTLLCLGVSAVFAALVPVVSAQSMVLTWTDTNTNEDGFTIERAPGLNATTGFVVIANVPVANAAERTGTGVRTWTDTTVAAASAYSYRLRAYNAAGFGPWSNTASGTSRPAAPANAPGSLGAEPPPAYVPPSPTVTLSPGESLTVVAAALTAQ